MDAALLTYCEEYLKGQHMGGPSLNYDVMNCAVPNPDQPIPPVLNQCAICRRCGGKYPVFGGKIGADNDWDDYFKIYDGEC